MGRFPSLSDFPFFLLSTTLLIFLIFQVCINCSISSFTSLILSAIKYNKTTPNRSLYNSDGTLCDTASIPLGGRGYVGAYSPEARRERIERFLAKRDKRVWTKKVKYDVRKNFADSRLRVKVRRERGSVMSMSVSISLSTLRQSQELISV